jgi:ATP-dependent RNA helicase RhlE
MSQPVPTFHTLGLSPATSQLLVRLKYLHPTPIQASAIPVVLAGHDLLARAQTGTGKTAAFALPIIERLIQPARTPLSGKPRALVLVPTRELAVQVERAIRQYGAASRLRTIALFGGVAMGPQLQALRQRPDLIVATPGRLLDHLQRRTVDLSGVEILTLDEADRMLDFGFLPALKKILQVLPSKRQTLLFSATLPREVLTLAASMTREARNVDVGERVVAPTVTHQMHAVSDHSKAELLARVLSLAPVGQALVFCRTKRGSDRVGRHLDTIGVQAAVIHGNKSQSARTRALDGFRGGRVRVLVATDIAARGIDIAQLPLVVNYDLPDVAEDYVHRVGRTGRAGVPGRAISLVSPQERGSLDGIQRLIKMNIERIALDGFPVEAAKDLPRPQGHRPAPPRAHTPRPWHSRRSGRGRGRGDKNVTASVW